MKAPLVLIDASSYFFRAFHALPPLTNSKGQATGAVYGVANMIKKLIKDYQPEELAVVFDAKGKTFRDDWYPEYKANRPPMPDELSSQFDPLLALLKAMGFPLLIVEGVEADDVIGTIAYQAAEAGQNVLISTGDKDMAQLVNERVSLINTMSNHYMDVVGVYEKFGVRPEQIIDYLTLVGDSVDNVPGVTKCGPKTAAKWLAHYDTLDNLIHHAHEIGGKIGEYLAASLEYLPLSKKLVTIKKDVTLPLSLAELRPKPVDKKTLLGLVQELEFKNWIKELLAQEELASEIDMNVENQGLSYELVTEMNQVNYCIDKIVSYGLFCIDTETTSLDPLSAEIVGISLAVEPGAPYYIPLMHEENRPQLAREEVLAALKPILENPNIKKIGQNIKYDYEVFKNYNIQLEGMAFDTMLESYVLNSNANRHDMDSLALKYLGCKTITYEEVAGKGAKQIPFAQVPIAAAAAYAAEDADVTLRLHQCLYPMMDNKLKEVFHEIEMPLVPVLAAMEGVGVLIDPVVLGRHGIRLKERILVLEQEAISLAGSVFNLNSPKQVQEILFDQQKLPVIAKTPTGQPSTAESVLQELAYEYRLPAVILEYRGLTKLISTYIDALPRKINAKTHRVHTSYNQAVAATGRLSSSEPNLQNIPIRTEEGRLIRTAFIAPPGHLLLAADYSQIELRIMAHLSQDSNLLKAFALGWDIHAATASEIFQRPLEAVTSEERRRAKAVNFGLIYGMSAFGLSKQLGVDRADAQHYINIYFERYPGVLNYMEQTKRQAHAQTYVETMFGRRLYLPEINASNLMRQKAAERMAINAPMQGTAADIIKKTMIAISNWQNSFENPPARMIMQVHDELVFEVIQDQLDFVKAAVQQIMEHTVELSVPLIVTVGIGANWDEAH